jgi:hypothetical protein
MSRAVLRCQACHHSLLDAFTSIAGVSLKPQRIRRLPPTHATSVPRSIHTTARRFQSIQSEKSNNEADQSIESVATPDTLQSESTSIPWYLEIDNPSPPTPSISPVLARQQIPPLPNDPPEILSTVLNHLSISIGLDDLALLDLRTLSPPPALGANLLMIIGTARSVKHLNVSADRFCRWLRTNYKLRPYADGLLGRNELKLKLRRKARRLKLERAAGRQSDENADDGITTGWVCVNVGPVDHVKVQTSAAEEVPAERAQEDVDVDVEDEEEYVNPEEPEVDEEGMLTDPGKAREVDASYVGFGSRATSQRIVVQMFTEEKRAEMNLEELWNARNTKRLVKEQKADARAYNARRQRETQGLSAEGVAGEEGEDVEEILRTLDDLSVEEKAELKRRVESLRQVDGNAAGARKQEPQWSPIFNVKS